MKSVRLILFIIFSFTFVDAKYLKITSSKLELLMRKNIVIIDIRKDKEWKKTGIIPNSYKLTYIDEGNEYNIKRWLYIFSRLVKSKSTKFVLVSKTSKKSKELAEFLSEEKKYMNVYYLKNGIESWIKEDKKVLIFK